MRGICEAGRGSSPEGPSVWAFAGGGDQERAAVQGVSLTTDLKGCSGGEGRVLLSVGTLH